VQDKYPKKILPKLRGEKWLTWDGRRVTVLGKWRGGAVEVLNEQGKTEILYGSEFKHRLDLPPVVDGVDKPPSPGAR
jgi:hypothetical protein